MKKSHFFQYQSWVLTFLILNKIGYNLGVYSNLTVPTSFIFRRSNVMHPKRMKGTTTVNQSMEIYAKKKQKSSRKKQLRIENDEQPHYSLNNTGCSDNKKKKATVLAERKKREAQKKIANDSTTQYNRIRTYNSSSFFDRKEEDTIRVRIWRVLASGEEISLSDLSKAVGCAVRKGELRSHLSHVEKQAKTLKNKSSEWRIRRGLLPKEEIGNNKKQKSLKLIQSKRGPRNELYLRLRK